MEGVQRQIVNKTTRKKCIHKMPYCAREHTGRVYTKSSLSLSSITRKSLSTYLHVILQLAALPLFHGKIFHTAPTGIFVPQIHSPKKRRKKSTLVKQRTY